MVPGGPWPPGNPSQNRGPHKPLKNSGLFGIGEFGRRKKIRRNQFSGEVGDHRGLRFCCRQCGQCSGTRVGGECNWVLLLHILLRASEYKSSALPQDAETWRITNGFHRTFTEPSDCPVADNLRPALSRKQVWL